MLFNAIILALLFGSTAQQDGNYTLCSISHKLGQAEEWELPANTGCKYSPKHFADYLEDRNILWQCDVTPDQNLRDRWYNCTGESFGRTHHITKKIKDLQRKTTKK